MAFVMWNIHYVILGIVLLLIHTTSGLQCGDCRYSRTHSECKRNPRTCTEKCFIEKFEDVHGSFHYRAGCATQQECDFMKFHPPLLGKREPMSKQTCGECCDDADMCNMKQCYAPTTTTTTTTTKPVQPVQCEVCSGPVCGLTKFTTSNCTHEKPYCMNTVVNAADGTRQITKGCTSVADCRVKWLKTSSDNRECQTYDIQTPYPFDLTCDYCCTKDNCNLDFIPKPETLYREQ